MAIDEDSVATVAHLRVPWRRVIKAQGMACVHYEIPHYVRLAVVTGVAALFFVLRLRVVI